MYCQCGCGAVTTLISVTNRSKGEFAGQYRRFVKGHHNRSNRGLPADLLIDECDSELLSRHYWYFDERVSYVYTVIRRRRVYLHRLITGAGHNTTVLHLDENRLNNRRANLFVREKTPIPTQLPTSLDDGFGHWFAGFVDGEGCFQISVAFNGRNGPSYRCLFDITLRFDDAPILEEARRRIGVGSINYFQPTGRRSARAVRWHVKNKDEALFLTRLFDMYPLRAKKAKDYAIWREAVLSWHDGTKGRGLRGDYSTMATCRSALLALRQEGRIYPTQSS